MSRDKTLTLVLLILKYGLELRGTFRQVGKLLARPEGGGQRTNERFGSPRNLKDWIPVSPPIQTAWKQVWLGSLHDQIIDSPQTPATIFWIFLSSHREMLPRRGTKLYPEWQQAWYFTSPILAVSCQLLQWTMLDGIAQYLRELLSFLPPVLKNSASPHPSLNPNSN